MGDEFTGPDTLRQFLSGAGSDGGVQTDPDLALGNFRSATEVVLLGITETNPILNITPDYVSGKNGKGSGILQTVSANQIRWTAPGSSTPGPAVTIENSETKVLEDGEDAAKYVRVTRGISAAITGSSTLTLTDIFNNLVGFDNISSVESNAGQDDYRAMFFKNVSGSALILFKVALKTLGTTRVSDDLFLPASGAGTIKTLTGGFGDHPTSGYERIETAGGALKEVVYYTSRDATELTVPATGRGLFGTTEQVGTLTDNILAVPGLRIGKEAPSAQPAGFIQTIPNQNTAPGGIAWNLEVLIGNGVDIGTLNAGEIFGLWMHRTTPAGSTADPDLRNLLQMSFDA